MCCVVTDRLKVFHTPARSTLYVPDVQKWKLYLLLLFFTWSEVT